MRAPIGHYSSIAVLAIASTVLVAACSGFIPAEFDYPPISLEEAARCYTDNGADVGEIRTGDDGCRFVEFHVPEGSIGAVVGCLATRSGVYSTYIGLGAPRRIVECQPGEHVVSKAAELGKPSEA